MASKQYGQLTQDDVDHFLTHGWIKVPSCFSREAADKVTADVWTRLGMDPNDKSTWNTERTNMPSHKEFLASDFAPKAWTAISDLLGGEGRVGPHNRTWNDALIVNLGTPEGEGKVVTGNHLPEWHVDGDMFVHYLDSPEQALLVIPLFTDIKPNGGGTFICPDAIKHVAEYLHAHPEGVSPRFTPRKDNPTFEPEDTLKWFNDLAASMPPEKFVEATGEVGDVYLLHPLMLHCASNNMLRIPRIITNPAVSLNEPFDFNRQNGDEYSIVEKKTLKELGQERLGGWKIAAPREAVVPERIRNWRRMREEELKRLDELKNKANAPVAERVAPVA